MESFASRAAPYAEGRLGPMGSLADAELASRLREYRKSVAKRYRSVDAAQLERFLPEGRSFISAKLDGELWFFVKRGSRAALCAYNGRVLEGLAFIDAAAARLPSDVLVAGELVASSDRGRSRVGHVARALADSAEAPRLSFHAFDLLEENGESVQSSPYSTRLARLRALFDGGAAEAGPRLTVVTTVEGEPKDAASYYREWVASQIHEGLVVRTELGATYKVKPYFSLDAAVIAYGTRMNGTTPELRELTVALRRDDGTFHVLGTVGGGVSAEDRAAWYARLGPLEVPSGFRMANRDGGLSRFVRPEIVVEIQCSDLLDTDSDDLPIERMTLSYETNGGYTPVGDARIASMLFPVLLRERTDKVADVACIGLEQITSRLPLDTSMDDGRSLEPSSIVFRRVFTKGETAVRKVSILETHKEGAQFPAFVTFFTDYSATRAEPLKTSLRTAATRELADTHVSEWLEENVKRGWIEVGAEPPAKPEKAEKSEKPEKAAAAPKKPRKKKGEAEAD